MYKLVPFVVVDGVRRPAEYGDGDISDLAHRVQRVAQQFWKGPAICVKAHIAPEERSLIVESLAMAYFIIDNVLKQWGIVS